MENAGLPAYEISNHARPGQESRHKLSYWLGHDYAGIGPGAHGRLTIGEQRHATQTLKSPERWLSAVQERSHGSEIWEPLSDEQTREEKLMMRLRLIAGLPRSHLPWTTDAGLSRLAGEGVLARDALDAGEIRLTLQGRLVLNYVTARLLAA